VNPATVHFRSISEPPRVSVLEQNYEYDLLEPDKLLRKYVGREVTLVRNRQENGSTRQEEVKARLLSYNNGPIWQIGNEIVTGLSADHISFPELPDNLYTRPTLIWTLQNDGATASRIGLRSDGPYCPGVTVSFRSGFTDVTDAVRAQMRAIGTHQGLSPVLDICRDPRWGRLEESYGEDPFLVSQMGVAFITGLQGSDDGRDLRDGVVATAKHFVGYGASEGGMNWAPAHLGERELRDVYLRPFEAAVRDAGLASVMNAYQELDGIPCAANRWLLTELLRGEWGFDGTVVSDYFAIKQLDDYHGIVGTWEDAAVTALTSGIDVELPSTECYGDVLRSAIDAAQALTDDVVGEMHYATQLIPVPRLSAICPTADTTGRIDAMALRPCVACGWSVVLIVARVGSDESGRAATAFRTLSCR